jgi:hypothetical protein
MRHGSMAFIRDISILDQAHYPEVCSSGVSTGFVGFIF